eukprot:Opistho-2@15661
MRSGIALLAQQSAYTSSVATSATTSHVSAAIKSSFSQLRTVCVAPVVARVGAASVAVSASIVHRHVITSPARPVFLVARLWTHARANVACRIAHTPSHISVVATSLKACIAPLGWKTYSSGASPAARPIMAREFSSWRRTSAGESDSQAGAGAKQGPWSASGRASFRLAIIGAHLQAALALADHVHCEGQQTSFFHSWGASPKEAKSSESSPSAAGGDGVAAQSDKASSSGGLVGAYPTKLRLETAVSCQAKADDPPSQRKRPVVVDVLPAHKRCECGEDAFFVTETKKTSFIGVADGVGGWRSMGVDPSEFAWALMINSEKAALEKDEALPKEILALAYAKLLEEKKVLAGSSTATILALDKASGIATATNMGDSGFIVMRDGAFFGESKEQQHYFNCPYQLSVVPQSSGVVKQDKVSMADMYRFQLHAGDIIVMATDGLLDNMFTGEIEEVITHVSEKGGSLKEIADAIVSRAETYSHDANRMTPFARAAQQAKVFHRGGKVDDITVIVAKVVPDVSA